MLRQGRLVCLLVVAMAAGGCLAAPRFGYVNVEQLVGAPAGSRAARAHWNELSLGPRLEKLARHHGLNLVFSYSAIVYVASDLDLTPVLQGQPDGPFRVGMRGGVVDMQRVLNTTREGKQAKARLKQEFVAKQAELDRLQRELRDRYSGNEAIIARSPEHDALLLRFQQLRYEMATHEREATKAIVERFEAETKELALARGLDVVVEANALGKDVVYRNWSRYLFDRPSLTDDLIRLHDQRFPGS